MINNPKDILEVLDVLDNVTFEQLNEAIRKADKFFEMESDYMNKEDILDIVQDFVNHIRFNEKQKYSEKQWFMAIEDLLLMYRTEKLEIEKQLQQEKEKNKKLEKVIDLMAEEIVLSEAECGLGRDVEDIKQYYFEWAGDEENVEN